MIMIGLNEALCQVSEYLCSFKKLSSQQLLISFFLQRLKPKSFGRRNFKSGIYFESLGRILSLGLIKIHPCFEFFLIKPEKLFNIDKIRSNLMKYSKTKCKIISNTILHPLVLNISRSYLHIILIQ
jgi:hypothetical protein